MNDNNVIKLEEKIKYLEKSIIEFENNHIKQVNNLINLFSDVIDIIKDKKEIDNTEISSENNKKTIDDDELFKINADDYYYDEDKLNEFKNKNTNDIIEYIKKSSEKYSNFKDKNTNEIVDNIQNKDSITLEDIENNPYKGIEDELLDKINSLKIINIIGNEDSNISEIKYKIEKNVSPVEIWIDAFKKTARWENMKNKMNSYITNNETEMV